MREVREREVTGESESEGERESDIFAHELWWSLHEFQLGELETPRPEYPGQWPEYSGRVLQSFPLKEISSRDLG